MRVVPLRTLCRGAMPDPGLRFAPSGLQNEASKELKRYAPFAGIMSRPSVALWTRSRSVRRSARR